MSEPDPIGGARARRTLGRLVQPVEQTPPRREPGGRQRPPESHRHVRLWVHRSKHPTQFTLLEARGHGLPIHYMDGRTDLCLKGIRYCYGCEMGVRLRWRGFIGAHITKTRTPIIVELTPWAVVNCEDLRKRDGGLLYARLMLRRERDSAQSKMWAALSPPVLPEVVPYWPHAEVVLARRYQVPEMEIRAAYIAFGKAFLDDGQGQQVS